MEPGDLRINARLRDDSGVAKSSAGSSYVAANEGNSVLQFRTHHNVRPDIIRDGRMHHLPLPMGGVPLMLDRNEPVKVWRDPSLMNSGEIRHVVSMQHSGVVHLTHPMVSHGSVSSPVGVYQRHDNKPIDATSRMIPQAATDASRGRAPVVFAPAHAHPPNLSKPGPECWRPPGVHQQQKDFRVNVSGKSAVEQAVQDHFEESLRLAQYKGAAHQSIVLKHDERLNPVQAGSMQRFYPPPHDKRHHEVSNPQQVIYQIHPQHQALNKPELPTPPPLRSEQQYRTGNPVDNSRKHQIYGPPEIIARTHEASLQNSIRYEQESNSRLDAFPSDSSNRYQKLPSAPRRPPTQNDLQLERNRSPFAKQTPPQGSPNSYHMFPQQAQISKHKVISPAPSHIYGKPGPSGSRPYEINNDPSAPLPLTSKGGLTRSSQSSPTAYTHPTLPQHELRKTDVAFHMYNNAPPGYQPTLSPQAHIHQIQSQPLDLGGKRKLEDEPTYKGPNEYTNHASIKPIYGSRKPIDDPRSQLPRISAPVALSLTTSEVASKRKIDDSPIHLADSKKIRSDGIVGSSLVIVRKDHDMKPTIPEHSPDMSHISRQYTDNSVPLSLTVSTAESRIKADTSTSTATTPQPPIVDAEKSAAKPGATEPSPHSVITSTPLNTTLLCNGKHKEPITHEVAASTNSNTPVIDQNSEIDVCKVVKVEPETQSVSSSSMRSASGSSSTSKFSKVPKKAWVLQWHEGDNSKTTDESTSTVTGGTSTNNEASRTTSGDNAETSEKLYNGVAPSTAEGESKSAVQSVNGFGREKMNDSDPYSENESDTSGKDKMSTESPSTPKKGRKAKSGGLASPKPDLRKDGLCKRPPVSQLKKTGESFIQAETCNRVTPKIGKCRECRWHPSGRGSKKQSGAYCRFYGFRKLRYTKGGSLTVAGFSDPYLDPPKITEHDQFRLWLPSNVAPQGLDVTMSKFLLGQLCDQFCDLVRQEEEARYLAQSQELSVIAWKPLLKGVLEMCDVCDTTLFNFHWACGKCGFVVCLSCFKARRNESDKTRVVETAGKDRDEFHWLLCSNRCPHELDKLMLVQTIAGDALTELNKNVHSLCEDWRISQTCSCISSRTLSKQVIQGNDHVDGIDTDKETQGPTKTSSEETTDQKKTETPEKVEATPEPKNSDTSVSNGANGCTQKKEDAAANSTLNLINFKREQGSDISISRPVTPFKALTSSDGAELCKNVKHSWFCNGKLVRLLEPFSLQNINIFHELFKRGLPVLVSHVGEKLDKSLWTPDSFSKDFGDYKHDLIDCVSGETLPNQQMKKFWEGFSSLSKRMRDDNGQLLVLKVKDWPPTDDFAQTLPSRFQDLMAALPLPDYTLREGNLNLASRLPTEFMKPDLGPKMYIAYGAGASLDKGTTNLHLDTADRINVLVHCEIPSDIDKVEHDKVIMEAIEESDCDSVTVNRVLQDKEVPGALWHVYSAKDADKIRDLLNKIAKERGKKVENYHDAILDQSWYLDKKLRLRLRTEYNVEGYAILQCEGDAIFVPAGAPHQVRNLQNCIKVSEDFVSPENISQSLSLCEDELRVQSRAATNHEDKLQIKNIVYHAVKDASSVLLQHKTEKSQVHQMSSNDALAAAPALLSKDCQIQPSTSPNEFPPMVVNAATN